MPPTPFHSGSALPQVLGCSFQGTLQTCVWVWVCVPFSRLKKRRCIPTSSSGEVPTEQSKLARIRVM